MDDPIREWPGGDGRIDKQMLDARGMSENNLFGGDDVNPHPLGGSRLVRARVCSISGSWDERPYWMAIFWAVSSKARPASAGGTPTGSASGCTTTWDPASTSP